MPSGREGGCADSLLFFYVHKVVQIGFSVCVIANQKRSAVNRVMVYGFSYVQNRQSKPGAVSIPSVFRILLVLVLNIFAPLAVLCQQQHLVQVGGHLHFNLPYGAIQSMGIL